MPTNIPALDEYSGALADDDLFVIIDTSAVTTDKDRKIQVSHLRKQLARATVVTTTDPTVNDDSADGYTVGNFWLNTSDDGLFVCTDNTAGAAVWDEFGTGVTAFTGLSDVPASYSGQGEKYVRVNSGETGLEFATVGAPTQSFVIACSDETTDLTTGAAKVTFRMPFAFTLTAVRASVTTAPTDAALQVDINEGGVSILSTVLSIDSGEKTSTTAATPAVISDSSLADDAEITIDIDQVGSTVAGAGLKVALIGTKT